MTPTPSSRLPSYPAKAEQSSAQNPRCHDARAEAPITPTAHPPATNQTREAYASDALPPYPSPAVNRPHKQRGPHKRRVPRSRRYHSHAEVPHKPRKVRQAFLRPATARSAKFPPCGKGWRAVSLRLVGVESLSRRRFFNFSLR